MKVKMKQYAPDKTAVRIVNCTVCHTDNVALLAHQVFLGIITPGNYF